MGDGSGNFGQAVNVNTENCFLVSGCPIGTVVQLGDINRDGRLDIAVTSSNEQSVLVLLQLAVDTDSDGVPDDEDDFPNDPGETTDTDGDGTGDNADTDDDNDGLSDTEEATYGTDPLNPDTDGDGVSDGDEVVAGRDPLVDEVARARNSAVIIINSVLLGD